MSEKSAMLYTEKQDEYDYFGDLTPKEWGLPFCKLLADAFLESLRQLPSTLKEGEKFNLKLPDSMPESFVPYWNERGFNITFRPATKRKGFQCGGWAKKHLVRLCTPSIWARLEGKYNEVKHGD